MITVRMGTRASRLALAQARLVCEGVCRHRPDVAFEVVGFTTSGDRLRDRPLYEMGGKGLFVGELDEALRSGRIDAAVHSLKDVPAELGDGIALAGFSPREDPRDVLVLPCWAAAAGCPDPLDAEALVSWLREGHRSIGCSSARRRVELQRLYPGAPVRSVRGNVPTRLQKLDRGEYGALVLAAAGLERLGLSDRASRRFEPDEMIPSAGQGIMVVAVRAGADASWLEGYADPGSEACARAERAFTRALGADCATPCAAYAVPVAGGLLLRGLYASPDGAVYRRASRVLSPDDAEAQAADLACEVVRSC